MPARPRTAGRTNRRRTEVGFVVVGRADTVSQCVAWVPRRARDPGRARNYWPYAKFGTGRERWLTATLRFDLPSLPSHRRCGKHFGCSAPTHRKVHKCPKPWGSPAVAPSLVEKGYGHSTVVIFGTTPPLFQGLRNGDVDVTLAIRLSNLPDTRDAAVAAEEVVLVGDWQSAFVISATCKSSISTWTVSRLPRTTNARRCSPRPKPAAKPGWCRA